MAAVRRTLAMSSVQSSPGLVERSSTRAAASVTRMASTTLSRECWSSSDRTPVVSSSDDTLGSSRRRSLTCGSVQQVAARERLEWQAGQRL